MRFGALVFGIAALFLQTECLEKTQEEAHKFLIDNGHVASDSTVESYQIDRQGNVRLQIDQGGKVVSYGLEPGTETYEIVFMSKNTNQKKRKTEDEVNTELEKVIGQKFAVLKGGKLGTVTRSSGRNKDQFEADYTVNSKVYKVTGRYNHKRGDVSIDKIEEPGTGAEL